MNETCEAYEGLMTHIENNLPVVPYIENNLTNNQRLSLIELATSTDYGADFNYLHQPIIELTTHTATHTATHSIGHID